MKIVLFSNDERLAAFCTEILTETFGGDSKLEVGVPGQPDSGEDLCLWDFIPGETSFPKELETGRLSRHLFLLHRQHLPALQEMLGTSEINVLLKPLTPATLRAFLGEAHHQQNRHPGNVPASLETLRVERDEMLQFLIQANLRLQEYDQERTNFLGRSIHDLQAPLSALNGYCVLLLNEELGSLTPDQRETLGRMQQSAKRLSRITDAMFRLSVREQPDQGLNLENGDMRECLGQALNEIRPFLEDKRISLSVEIEQPPEGLFCDRSRMEQALTILLDNARKFTPRNGAIDIRGYPYFWERRTCQASSIDPSVDRRVMQVKTANSFRLDIRDSGPGIPPVQLEKIFAEHSSYSGMLDRSGGGLGLAICRMILRQHCGCVWAESHGAGAAFCLVLPIQQPAGSTDMGVPAGPANHAGATLAEIKKGWS